MNRWIPRLALAAIALVAIAYHFFEGGPGKPGVAAASVTKDAAGVVEIATVDGRDALVFRGDEVPQTGATAVVGTTALRESMTLAPNAIAIPVVGIERSELRDTYGAPRSGGRGHAAIDILAPRGTPVVAAVRGEILQLFTSRAGGLTVYLADSERRTVYYYAHLDRYADGLAKGASVEQGAILGYVGTSGNAPAHAPHLHFAIERLPDSGEWWKGVPENPYPVLMSRGVPIRR